MKKEQTLTQKLREMASERKAKKISLVQLINFLAELAEGRYTKGYLIMASEPSGFKKTGNPFYGRVKKLSGWGFDVNIDYSRKVNLQLERENKEADFVAKETYTEQVNKIVHRHKVQREKLYMSCFPALSFGQFTEYLVDGRPATKEEIAQIKTFLPAKNTDSGRQGTEKKIEIRKPLLTNIYLISLAGKRYFVTDNLFQLQD